MLEVTRPLSAGFLDFRPKKPVEWFFRKSLETRSRDYYRLPCQPCQMTLHLRSGCTPFPQELLPFLRSTTKAGFQRGGSPFAYRTIKVRGCKPPLRRIRALEEHPRGARRVRPGCHAAARCPCAAPAPLSAVAIRSVAIFDMRLHADARARFACVRQCADASR